MIVEKKGKTTIYKCGKRYETIKVKLTKKQMDDIKETVSKITIINETVTEPESIPDKKNKKKTLKEG